MADKILLIAFGLAVAAMIGAFAWRIWRDISAKPADPEIYEFGADDEADPVYPFRSIGRVADGLVADLDQRRKS